MRIPWRAALGLVLGAALLYWVLRGTSWTDLLASLRASNVLLWAAAIVVSQLIFPLRALRWRPILAPIAQPLAFGPLWRATAIGMMITTVIPARVGELARAYALAREEPRVPFAAGLGSLVVDRAFDGLIVLILIFVAVLDPRFTTELQVGTRTVGTIVALASAGIGVVLVGLYFVVYSPSTIEAIVGALSRRFARRWETPMLRLTRRFIEGLAVLRNPRLLAAVFFWALALWLTNAVSVWLGFKALHIDVPFTTALLTQGLIAIGAAAFPTQGFFGVFEGVAVAALSLYKVDQNAAKAWALTYHVLTLLPINAIGAWYFSRLGLSLAELRRAPEQTGTA